MKYTLFMYTGISQTQAVVYRRARHCEPQCMAHALSSYHGPHRMNDTTFCRLRDIWARQEHASQRTEIDKYIKKMWQHQEQYSRKMVDFRSDVIVLSANISRQTAQIHMSKKACVNAIGSSVSITTLRRWHFLENDPFFPICNIESFSFDSYWLIDFHAFVTVTYGWHFKSFQIVG